MPPTSTDPSLYPPQPADGVICVHQADGERLVFDIPPGKGSGGIGCFAILWNGFMAVFTTIMVIALGQPNQPKFELLPFLFLSVFWLVGLGLIYAWLKLKFERSFLLVERERAVLRKMLFGRQQQKELPLGPESRAQLTESYQENKRPVYRVTVSGAGGDVIHFGTSLDPAEKDWCCDAINTLLQPPPAPAPALAQPASALCEACGAVLPDDAFHNDDGDVICPACEHQQAVPVAAIAASGAADALLESLPLPEALPGVVTILADSSDGLELQLALTEYAAVRWGVAAVAGGFAAFWYLVAAGNLIWRLFANGIALPAGVFDWIGLLFPLPFLLAGLIPLGIALLALCGRITTRVDRDRLRVRVHVGPFGRQWTMDTLDITAVRLTSRSDFPSQRSNPRIAAAHVPAQEIGTSRAAAAFAGSRLLAMTVLHQLLTARFVVAKVRTWLEANVPELKGL